MHKKHHDKVLWALVLTQMSHLFCCVLPGLLSLVSLLIGAGLIVALPGWVEGLHEFMHHWEVHVIVFAGVVAALGWGLHFYSIKEDCHDHGCHHEPCGPRKKAASKLLIVATVLFVVNVLVYIGFHSH